ncbi:MAG: hypothetical protein E6Q50_02275 [Lysobacter sp.]|nr:MAG: hypothetical protein E6Q50_02275 [Lysobacter sp.]
MTPQEAIELSKTIEALRNALVPPENDWIPVVAAIGGALVGAFATAIPSWITSQLEVSTKKKILKATIRAEISALVQLLETRKYADVFKGVAEELENQGPDATKKYPAMPESQHYLSVFKNSSGQLGLLEPNLAETALGFYYTLEAALMDFKADGIFTIGAKAKNYRDAEKLFNDTVTLGKRFLRESST